MECQRKSIRNDNKRPAKPADCPLNGRSSLKPKLILILTLIVLLPLGALGWLACASRGRNAR